MSKPSKTTITALNQKIIAALGSQLKTNATITLGGEVYKAKDLQQQLQAEVDAAATTQSAKTAWQQAVLAETKAATQAASLRKTLRAYLIGTYGAKSATVAEFGYTPKEPTVDVATKAAAIKKRAATRTARGTMGSRQKRGIKGTVPAASASAAAEASPPVQSVPAVNSITPKTTVAS
jgi:hypothetical protein